MLILSGIIIDKAVVVGCYYLFYPYGDAPVSAVHGQRSLCNLIAGELLDMHA